MINLLLGAPGGGKSYEAVAFHVLPALASGRKVITNLPLNLDAFPAEWRSLIDLRVRTKAQRETPDENKIAFFMKRFGKAPAEKYFNPNPFAHVVDYGDKQDDEERGITQYFDTWRHPTTGEGPLYVIDECHKPLPKSGTPIQVEEWYAEHRHGRCDVLLMTQSHGKINTPIKELVQLVYRVRKGTALGFNDRYIRKVADGINGVVMNEETRIYDETYFKYYRSHTQSTTAGKEAAAKDVVPIWKHWTFKGAALCVVLAIPLFIYAGNPFKVKGLEEAAKNAKATTTTTHTIRTVGTVAPAPVAPPLVAVVESPALAEPTPPTDTPAVPQSMGEPQPDKGHPLAGLGLHIAGFLQSATKTMYLFTVSQNGQLVYQMNESDIVRSGYVVKGMNDCIAQVTFERVSFYVTCDAPRVGVNPSGAMTGKPTT